MGIEIALEKKLSRYSIDATLLSLLLHGTAGLGQMLFGFPRSQTLIPKLDRDFQYFLELCNKRLHLISLETVRAVHIDRQPDKDSFRFFFNDQLADMLYEIGIGFFMVGVEWLGGHPQGVTCREPDALLAIINRKDSFVDQRNSFFPLASRASTTCLTLSASSFRHTRVASFVCTIIKSETPTAATR